MIFRVFVIDDCVSDIHFLPLYQRAISNPLTGAVLQTIVLFIISLLSSTTWFVISGFLIYQAHDARILILGAACGAGMVVSAWLPALCHMNKLKTSIVDGFLAKYCDENNDITQDSAGVVAQDGVQNAVIANPVHRSATSN